MKKESQNRGSATVFLCLMSGVMLSLVISIIGIMQYRWEKTQIIRCANISVRSEFGKYYRPLYDTYRMFYYVNDVPERFDAGVAGYFLDNQKNMPDYLKLSLSYIDVSDKLYAINKGGSNVRTQMSNAAKYMLGEKAYEKAVKQFRKQERKIKDSQTNESVNEELERAADELDEIEDKVKLESKLLELLRIVEGISIVDGKVVCHDGFVKEGLIGKVTPFAAGVDSDKVWQKAKASYWSINKLPALIRNKARKGIGGKKESIPVAKVNSWCDGIERLLRHTQKACEIIKGIKGALADGEIKAICDVNVFSSLLKENMLVLQKLSDLSENMKLYGACEYQNWFDVSTEIINLLKGYHVKELIFDYSTLTLCEVKDPRKNAGKLAGGIPGMLVEEQKDISKKTVSESDVYAKIIKAEDTAVESTDYTFGDDAKELKEFLGECKSSMESKWDDIGVRMYISLLFDSYVNKNSSISKQLDKKALDYELEYIVAGKETDEQNLKAVVNMIMLERTGETFVRILTDSKNRDKAYAAAAAIVGFTGVDALVRCVQLTIIAAWAYEEACVDMAILLAGKKLPLIKNKLFVAFEEMLLFNKEFIKSKVMQYDGDGIVDYAALLNTLLLTRGKNIITCRTMDIIQNNIKLNCSKRFSFQNCIYGADVMVGCSKPYECSAEVKFEYE